MIKQAVTYMKTQHEGQMYGSEPYWKHPYQVATSLPGDYQNDSVCYVAALFHDLLEDTDANPEYIEAKFGKEVLEIVQLLTKPKGMDYKEYVEGLIASGNKRAMIVKLTDNLVNFSGDKSDMTKTRRDKLNDKYIWSMNRLIQELVKIDD